MSYRITARDHKLGKDLEGDGEIYHQIYGNNEYPTKLIDYLKSKGVEFDEDSCFLDYEVENLQELLEVMLEVHKDTVEPDYWDLTPSVIYKPDTVDGLISYCEYKIDCAVVFIMYNFVKAFDSCIETYWEDGTKYKIKEGKKIYLSGF